ncbi:hypothetical protein ACFSWE_02160 [Leucobacter albus]|uniref:Alpha-tubulin suppressor-like RCC1 family protein n=1 Tax=Leucobacter albus TaxID=272210 RepID=A0ABW3TMI2_9MICO
MNATRFARGNPRLPKLLLAGGAMLSLAALLTADATAAGFVDSTYGTAQLRTESPLSVPPVDYDQSANSSLFLTRTGDLYVAGDRRNGDGNGGTQAPTAEPTRVNFGEGVTIIDAIGSTNDFHTDWTSTNSYMALDSNGGVWTWGRPYGGGGITGHGPQSDAQSRAARRVTQVEGGGPMPAIMQISRSENQFYAIDGEGNLWAWGYDGENLPVPTSGNRAYPALANTTVAAPSTGTCATSNAGVVRWHSLWGGNNSSGAVATNGLIYTWGHDTSNGLTATQVNARCPALHEGPNRVLFQRYPELYQTAAGEVYDEATLTTEAARHARYLEIVEHMRPRTLAECSTVKPAGVVDESACPVRQYGFSARAGRLLLQTGELFTWKISTASYGDPFLGRAVTAATPAYAPHPVSFGGSTNSLDRVVTGVSASFGLTREGVLYGWGENNYCQAVGKPTQNGALVEADCAEFGRDSATGRRVDTPMPVQNLPEGQRVVRVAATQCAAWAETETRELWAWGGGTVSGADFRYCKQPSSGHRGYKIYDYGSVTDEHPLGVPVTATTTGTMRVRGE